MKTKSFEFLGTIVHYDILLCRYILANSISLNSDLFHWLLDYFHKKIPNQSTLDACLYSVDHIPPKHKVRWLLVDSNGFLFITNEYHSGIIGYLYLTEQADKEIQEELQNFCKK